MANEIRLPGLTSGVDRILEAGFGVSARPTVCRDEAFALVTQKIEREAIRCQRVCISELPVDRGTLFDMTGQRVSFPEGGGHDRCYVALLDSEPVAPWGHPAFWAFVPVDGRGDIVVSPTQFPANAKGSVRFIEVLR